MSPRDLGLVLLICVAWAFNFLTSAHALREIPPFMFTALRLGLLVAVLAPFAPQLAYPKTFDDGVWRRHIGASGIVRPPIRETMDRVVGYLIEHDWARARDARGGVE